MAQFQRGEEICSAESASRYLLFALGIEEREVFGVIFLDSQHRIITFEKLFWGTVNAASVYPREIVKRALALNAAAVLLAHNHPSGISSPSEADKAITSRIRDALTVVDIRVLDHIIVGADSQYSFAANGLI
nr:DNA repair protein RadC [uncultured Microbulbifer sp.]